MELERSELTRPLLQANSWRLCRRYKHNTPNSDCTAGDCVAMSVIEEKCFDKREKSVDINSGL